MKMMAAQELCISRSEACVLGEQSPGMGQWQLQWSDFNACESPPRLLVLINHTAASAHAPGELVPIFCQRMPPAFPMQSAGDKSWEPKGSCSQRGHTGQWGQFLHCHQAAHLGKCLGNLTAAFLKSAGLAEMQCRQRRNRVSEGSALISSFTHLFLCPHVCFFLTDVLAVEVS